MEVRAISTTRTCNLAARRRDHGYNQEPAGARGKALGKTTYKGKYECTYERKGKAMDKITYKGKKSTD